MRFSRVLLFLMRAAAVVQIVLGVGFWAGHWRRVVPLHWAVGLLYVLLLWMIALVALFQRRRVGVALLALPWGILIAAIGFAQQGILAGSGWHWIVRVVHLAVGLAALGIAEQLAPVATVAVPPMFYPDPQR